MGKKVAKQEAVLSVVPTVDERVHSIEFTVTIRKFGKGEQCVHEARRALERAVRLTFGRLGEVHGEC